MASRLGERVGRFAALAVRRLTQVAASAASAAQAPSGGPEPTTQGTGEGAPSPSSPMARAESMIDGAGSQLKAFVPVGGDQFRRAAALTREEMEDIWAEAQQLRRARSRPSGDAPRA